MAECLHVIDVEGIPASSADKLSSYFQYVCSLILHREVFAHCQLLLFAFKVIFVSLGVCCHLQSFTTYYGL